MTARRFATSIALVALAVAALAPGRAVADDALRVDLFAYDTSDDAWVTRSAVSWLYHYEGEEEYQGIEGEHWRGSVAGRGALAPHDAVDRDRAYFRFAHRNDHWLWTGRVGSDGHTAMGSLSVVHDVPRRLELFLERDMVETPQGLEGLYYTYGGAAIDLPMGKGGRHTLTLLGGLQDFGDGNLREHARLRWSSVLVSDWGLSAQLHVRAFRDSDADRSDYYSPRWFAEAIPTLQLRRFRGGWMWLARAGVGRQRDSETGWHQARRAELSVTSPASQQGWHLSAGLLATDTPFASGKSERYRQLSFELTKRF
jgi:hypothetical protein